MVVNYNVSPSCHSRTKSVSSPYQVREKHLFYGSRHALGIGAASFASFFWGTGTGMGTGTGFGSGESEQR